MKHFKINVNTYKKEYQSWIFEETKKEKITIYTEILNLKNVTNNNEFWKTVILFLVGSLTLEKNNFLLGRFNFADAPGKVLHFTIQDSVYMKMELPKIIAVEKFVEHPNVKENV